MRLGNSAQESRLYPYTFNALPLHCVNARHLKRLSLVSNVNINQRVLATGIRSCPPQVHSVTQHSRTADT